MSWLSDISDEIGKLMPGQGGQPFWSNFGAKAQAASSPEPTSPKMTPDQVIKQMSAPGYFNAPNQSPSPTAQPRASMAPFQPPAPTTAPANGKFRYDMGKSDYSYIRPHIEAALKGTPLEPFINNFIQAGNQYGVDPRVLVTIASNESSMGRNYPTNTYNPFGYNASGAGKIKGPDGKDYVNVDQGLKDAGFTSLPMAIDRLTGRFQRQPTDNYKKFYSDPSVENLSAAYNATPTENTGYINNAYSLASQYFK